MKLMRRYLTLTLLLICGFSYAQENTTTEVSNEVLSPIDSVAKVEALAQNIALDSVKIDSSLADGKPIALIDHPEVSEFDKKWLEAWKNNVIDSSLIINPQDTIGKIVIDSFSTELLKTRIALLDSQTPFNFEYNPSLEKIIKHYLKNRPETLANLMGRAKYYFPIFEESLAKYDIPMELKYLAIVESALILMPSPELVQKACGNSCMVQD